MVDTFSVTLQNKVTNVNCPHQSKTATLTQETSSSISLKGWLLFFRRTVGVCWINFDASCTGECVYRRMFYVTHVNHILVSDKPFSPYPGLEKPGTRKFAINSS